MTRRRWIADEYSASRAALVGANARHLARVLRAQPGQSFDIACGGEVRQGTVLSVNDERVEFELGGLIAAPASIAPITVLLAIFKFDRMEWAIEKLTELGVAEVVPVVARRTEAHLASAADKRVERWRRIAHEASQQSRRAEVPAIAVPLKLAAALARYHSGARLVLDENESERGLTQAISTPAAEVTLAIGPEGGWTAEELAVFLKDGWLSASLGKTILRAETAAISAVAIVAHFCAVKNS